MESIRATGPSLRENPHNRYLELAAESGVIGLALYLGVLGAVFRCGIRALSRMGSGSRKHLLVGSLAALGGQCVDAMANPGWSFPEVGTFLWLIMGIAISCVVEETQPAAERRSQGQRVSAPRGFRSAAIALAIGILAIFFTVHLLDLDPLRSASAAMPSQPSYSPCQGPGDCCPGTREYWATNPDKRPRNSLKLGSRPYNKHKLDDLLQASPAGDASMELAQQLIAARFNVEGGVDPALHCPSGATAEDLMDQADALLSAYSGDLPYHVNPATPAGLSMLATANQLAEFNSGARTPACGACAGS